MNSPLSWLKPTDAGDSTCRAFVIRVIPDLFAREVLNVGVCTIDPRGNRHVRVISKPGRLACLYGDDGAQLVVELARAGGVAASSGTSPASRQIEFSDLSPMFNVSPQEAAEILFNDLVTVATTAEGADERVETITRIAQDELVRLVHDELRIRMPLNAERFIPEKANIELLSEGRIYSVPVHISDQKVTDDSQHLGRGRDMADLPLPRAPAERRDRALNRVSL